MHDQTNYIIEIINQFKGTKLEENNNIAILHFLMKKHFA